MKAHYLDGGEDISAEALIGEGIHYEWIDADPAKYRARIDRVKSERGYVEEDVVDLRPDMAGLDALCQKFIDEHHHDDDEVRYVLEGEGIFDIRSRSDAWMRVLVQRGDLIIVPRARHHRFLLTDAKAIRCVRLFIDRSGWVPHYRASA